MIQTLQDLEVQALLIAAVVLVEVVHHIAVVEEVVQEVAVDQAHQAVLHADDNFNI